MVFLTDSLDPKSENTEFTELTGKYGDNGEELKADLDEYITKDTNWVEK
ncbi:MAG: hypothetical protein ACTHZ1_12865 [Sphingobacterium sp.]